MNSIESILNYEITIFKSIKLRLIDLLFFMGAFFFAIFARLALFEYRSNDYNRFLSLWFDSLKMAGGIGGIGESLGDYTPPYIYILAFLTHLPIASLVSIKLVSCIFDFACAFIIMKIVYDKSKLIVASILAFTIFLFSPTILLNGAFWAQCDIIFTFFLVLCVYYFIKNKPFSAMVFFSIAFCFKLQAIFILPLIVLLWLKGKVKLKHFFIIPTVYIISILPAWIKGRSFSELLTIYFRQSGQYPSLSLNAPNLYTWFSDENSEIISRCGVIICFVAIAIILYTAFSHKIKFDTTTIITFALFFSLIMPFLLPHMHERYFFTADVFAILYAFIVPKRFHIAIGVCLCSLLAYCPYLFGTTPISLKLVAVIMLVIIALVSLDLKKLMKPISE